jgi:hypothetical protein
LTNLRQVWVKVKSISQNSRTIFIRTLCKYKRDFNGQNSNIKLHKASIEKSHT